MEIEKALSVDEIYEKVRDYDLVLTVDAPLADALNARLEEPRLGTFATTPKKLTYRRSRKDLLDRKGLFLKIIRETDLTWKQASYLLKNAIDCWQETGELRRILGYENFDSEEMKEVIRIIEDTENIFSAMEDFSLEEENVAVVGLYRFNELDRKVLPESYGRIDFLTGGKEEIEKFRVFESATDIIQTLRNNINLNNADEIAVFVDPESEYQPLLESAFSAEGVPYMVQRDLSESEELRTFLLLLRSGLSDEWLRLRDVQPLLRRFEVNIPVADNRKFIRDLDREGVEALKELLSEVEERSFAEMLEIYEERTGAELKEVRKTLEDIDLLEKEINQEQVNRLEYYLESFELKEGSGKGGVLFASPKSVSYIDRPIVFYLGLTSQWDKDIPGKPWIDQEEREEKNKKDFQTVIQNGQDQYYLVQDKSFNQKVTPCFYFNEILDEDFESFSDLPHERYQAGRTESKTGFEKEDRDVKIDRFKFFSQSSLNLFVRCPRDYFFSRLVSDIDEEWLKRGNLYHDFAEFYVNHPDFVEEKGWDAFLEVMIGEISSLVDDFRLKLLKTEFLIGLKNIKKYLDESDYSEKSWKEFEKRDRKNIFAKRFNKDISFNITEIWFENSEIGAKGKIDLLESERSVVDYKSGSKKSKRNIVRSSNVDLFEDSPNFQAILYLTALRRVNPGEKLSFTFYHFLENIGDVVSGEEELEDNIVTVNYYPKDFSGKIADREIFEMLIEGVSESNSRRKTLEKLGYPKYREIMKKGEKPSFYEKEDALESDFAVKMIKRAKSIVGDYKYVEKGCRSALRKLIRFRKENYFKEDLDRFEEFLQEQIALINRYKKTRFPVGDIDLDKTEFRDLILYDE
ncbi:MAG: PD-(D/E)XK nuclease family protein [Candidatus Aenigmatarchaeota archaeon]